MTFRIASLALATALTLSVSPLAAAFAQHAATHSAADEVSVGDLHITGAFTRATLPNAPVAGGFLTITNDGDEDDRLVAVSSSIAKESQIHEMAMVGDVMKMQPLESGLPIPAGETVELAPGGYHLMFMGLNGSIAVGDKVAVTLTFEKAGEVNVELLAGEPAAQTSGAAPKH